MLENIIEIAKSNNAILCPKCKKIDYGLGLPISNGTIAGKCIHCGNDTKKFSRPANIKFSLELLRLLLIHFDDNSTPQEKQFLNKVITNLIKEIEQQGDLKSTDEILRIQALFKSIDTWRLGSPTKIGATLTYHKGKAGEFNMSKENPNMKGAKALAVCALAIDYILKYNVPNKVNLKINQEPRSAKPTAITKNAGNKGCLLNILLLVSLSILTVLVMSFII